MNAFKVPASIGQRLLWFMDHYRGDGGVLNCPVVLRLRGRLNVSALQAALDQITARHESLRTTFGGKGHTLTQIIHTPQPVAIAYLNLGHEADPDITLRESLKRELQTRIDPRAWPVRVTLWRLSEEDHVLCFNMHHLVTDGHSCGLFIRELHLLYDRAVGAECELPEIIWQHAQFVKWENELLKSQAFAKHIGYWQQQLENARLPSLPYGPKQPGLIARQTETKTLDFDNSTVELLRRVARTRRSTIFNVMLSVYYTVLHRLTMENDLSIGSVFLNRPMPEVQHTIGFFANFLVLRTRIPADATFSDVLRNSHVTVMDAFMHQSVSYYMLPARIMQPSALRADELVFQMMTQPLYNSKMGGVDVNVLLAEGVGNRFDFELAVFTTESKLSAVVSFSRTRIEQEWAHAFLSRYVQVASLVARNPDVRLADLDADF